MPFDCFLGSANLTPKKGKSPQGCADGIWGIESAPTGVRTPASALRGPRPGPLDDGGSGEHSTTHEVHRQQDGDGRPLEGLVMR